MLFVLLCHWLGLGIHGLWLYIHTYALFGENNSYVPYIMRNKSALVSACPFHILDLSTVVFAVPRRFIEKDS